MNGVEIRGWRSAGEDESECEVWLLYTGRFILPGFIHFVNGSLINNIDAGLLVPVRDI